jgi:hypothetical protein
VTDLARAHALRTSCADTARPPHRPRHPAGVQGGSGWTPTKCAIFGVLTLLCLALSELTYRGIERPFLVRKVRLT